MCPRPGAPSTFSGDRRRKGGPETQEMSESRHDPAPRPSVADGGETQPGAPAASPLGSTAGPSGASDESYRLLFERSPYPMWVYDRETLRFLAVNQAAIGHYGFTRDEFMGMTVKDVRAEEDVPKLLHSFQATIQKSQAHCGLHSAGIWRHRRKDGTFLDVDIMWSPIPFNGRPAVLAYLKDVTDRLRVEEELGRTADRFAKMFQSSPVGVTITRLEDGLFLDVNQGFAEMLGYSRDELVGHRSVEVFDWLTPDERKEFAERARREGRIRNLEAKLQTRGGTVLDIVMSVEVIDYEGVPALLNMTRDITQRKRAEEARQQSEERFRLVARATNDVVWDWDLESNTLWWNDGVSSVMGYDRLEVGADIQWWYDRIHDADRKRVVDGIHAVIDSGARFWSDEYRYRRADGSFGHYYDRGYVLRDEAGQAVRMIGAMADMSERKREEALIVGQNQVLEMAARGEPLKIVLTALARLMEQQSPGMLCSILLLDEEGRRLRTGAAPSLPEDYNEKVDGLSIGPESGSCGTAVYRGEPVFVIDTLADPLWADSREIAQTFGLRACWSTPILSDKGKKALGSFAMYYKEVRSPSTRDLQLAKIATHIGRIAIEGNAAEAERTRMLLREKDLRAQAEGALAEIQEGRERLRMLSRRLVALQEAERREISRELHDEVGQVLTGLMLMLEASANGPPHVQDAVSRQEMMRLVNELMNRVREMSMNLRPPMLDDLGLIPALLWHFDRYTIQTQVHVDFHHSGMKRYAMEIETAAFRIIQEALTNVARHAGATEVKVEIRADRDSLAISVEDTGRGFDQHAVLSGASSGLAGMRERAQLVGGRFRIHTEPGRGTRLTAELPLPVMGGQKTA